ncbi:MAG: 3-carboxyethylcatechol 2,3-dioxygenase [Betaproteobacteria bacterium]|nr:3-carboxyethylcatechol 2,3-dioxygenase [Betaproteobacteria bacterium]
MSQAAMLVCASHSPLMLVDMPRSAPDSQDFVARAEEVRARVARFAPDLVVVFGPDHFNGFFFDLMPVFCIGAAAESTEDWQLPRCELNVPSALALDCVEHLRAAGVDVALSWRMKADHGITIPLKLFTGLPPALPVLPIFVNCAAPPRAAFRRVGRLGEEVGKFLATLDRRVLVLGSGGLSHDPPTPHFADAPPEVRKRLLERNTPSAADYRAREARVIRAARAMADGTDGGGPCRRPDESWDRAVIAALEAGATDAYDGMTDADIDREAGFGGHEIRCWIAACAAMRELGGPRPRLDYYRLVPEWITGMGLMTAGEP